MSDDEAADLWPDLLSEIVGDALSDPDFIAMLFSVVAAPRHQAVPGATQRCQRNKSVLVGQLSRDCRGIEPPPRLQFVGECTDGQRSDACQAGDDFGP